MCCKKWGSKRKLCYYKARTKKLEADKAKKIESDPPFLLELQYLKEEVKFLEKEVSFCKLESGFQTYGLIHLLGPSGPNIVSRPRSQGQDIFWDFMTLLDLSHDFWENVVLFVKIGARVLDLWFDTSFGPKWPKCSF